MLDWLRRTWDAGVRYAEQGLGAAARLAVHGLAGIVAFIFGNVSTAWADLERAAYATLQLGGSWVSDVTGRLAGVIDHLIPRYAMTAWWWVTHPEQLGSVLAWHVVRFLEDNAEAAARYVGAWALAWVTRNLRTVAHLAEIIIASVL